MQVTTGPMKLGIDVDGILVDFQSAHIARIKEQFGIELPPVSNSYPNIWDYHLAGGLTKQQDDQLWRQIRQSPTFWLCLSPLAGADKALTLIQMWTEQGRIEPYFITSRPGFTSHRQSVLWLKQHGIAEPQVLVVNTAQQKADLVKALGLTAFIDDRPENVIAVRDQIPEAMSFVLDKPWNRQMDDGRALRVTSMMEFFANVELA